MDLICLKVNKFDFLFFIQYKTPGDKCLLFAQDPVYLNFLKFYRVTGGSI